MVINIHVLVHNLEWVANVEACKLTIAVVVSLLD